MVEMTTWTSRAMDGEALDVVKLGELAVVVVGEEGHELLLGLFAEIAGVDEKENARGTSVLQQPVDLGDRGEGLAGPRGHLDERAGPVGLQRSLEFGDGLDLALAQAGGVERRERADTCPKRHPCPRMGLERRRAVEGEDLSGSRIRVAPVREPRDLSRALVQKRQRLGIGYPFELGGGVPFRLLLDGGDPFAPGVRFGFDDADGPPFAEEDISRRGRCRWGIRALRCPTRR